MDLQEIVRRLRMNQSIKAIKRETGRHRSVIRRVRELAEQEGWLQAAELPGERQLRELYHEQQQAERGAAHPLDAHREKIAGWGIIHQTCQYRGKSFYGEGLSSFRGSCFRLLGSAG